MSFKKKNHNEEAEENWLMSYADMITLLICFFVIMLSLMTMKQSDSEAVEQQLKEAFSGQVSEKPFTTLMEKIVVLIDEKQMDSEMSVEESYKGLVLELSSASFYNPGSADFRPEAIPILEELAVMLNDFDYEDYLIEVEGHTDDVPIKTEKFPSNWELSANRATRVVRFFIDKGQEKEKMRAAGFADVEPKVPNIDDFGSPIPENRELNRRIAIRIERKN